MAKKVSYQAPLQTLVVPMAKKVSYRQTMAKKVSYRQPIGSPTNPDCADHQEGFAPSHDGSERAFIQESWNDSVPEGPQY